MTEKVLLADLFPIILRIFKIYSAVKIFSMNDANAKDNKRTNIDTTSFS